MRRAFAHLLPILALAGCGPSDQPQNSEGAMANFTLSSDAFEDGVTIPTQYTCDGEDLSPALTWSDPPAGTQSFALVMDDPDAPSGVFGHWAAHGIDAQTRKLDIGAGSSGGADFAQGRNDFGNAGYGGPCPPPGHGPHRYRFKLYALDVKELTGLGDDADVAEVESEAQKHQIDRTELTGRYERS